MVLGHVGRWTEADYFALGETADRIELIDGCLLVTPVEDKPHQWTSTALASALDAPAGAAAMTAYRTVNVRLCPGRIVIPDLVVADAGPDGPAVKAADVALVGEVISSGDGALERLLKSDLFAAAGIPWYLLVDVGLSGSVKLQLQRLVRFGGCRYVEHLTARDGETLSADGPFAFELVAASLAGW
jgi:Uma2 family endonuclease